MAKLDLNFLANHTPEGLNPEDRVGVFARSGMDADLQRRFVQYAIAINQLEEAVTAKRYSLLAG